MPENKEVHTDRKISDDDTEANSVNDNTPELADNLFSIGSCGNICSQGIAGNCESR